MKVLLYFESQDTMKKSGIGRAMRHQMQALTSAGVDFTIDPKDKSYDMVHINTTWNKSKKLLKRCNKKGVPAIVHGHSTIEDFKNSFSMWPLIAFFWYNKQIKFMYKHADFIITPTPYSKRLIDSYGLGTPTVDLSNGISLEDYKKDDSKVEEFKKHFGITDEKVVIGIGYPFERKGIHDFFEVARKNPDVKFIWFGFLERILMTRKIKKAIKNKPANAIMPGYIDNAIIKGAMQYAKCLLFPSYEETEGIVVLEALASYCPVLVRRIGVYDEWLFEDKNCLMASNNDEFNEKLQLLLNNDYSEMTKEGYKVVEERTLDIIGQKMKNIYEDFYNNFKK